MDDNEQGMFTVLGLARLRLTGPFWWHTDDIDEANAKGAIFRAYREGDPMELANVIVVDVTEDYTEPDVAQIQPDNVSSTDEALKSGIIKDFEGRHLVLLEWMSSQLNEVRGLKALVTAYTANDPSCGDRQFVACRMNIHGKKIVLMCCFNISEAKLLAVPIFGVLKAMEIIPSAHIN
jgi:hypothetical protein